MSMGSFGYTVKPGDTLSEIARELGMSLEQLAAMNGIENPDYIVDGTELNTDGSESGD
ncbi:MAG: LysM peptidoglycan-binding domain-containing protein, partial [Acidimicrobiia bacterium]|nr:LysM peptidoglycan-binding domain-containing protein [Acidimicrobiia bacterium]